MIMMKKKMQKNNLEQADQAYNPSISGEQINMTRERILF